MIKIEDMCKKISDNIALELDLDNDKREVINYGIISFIQIGICIALVIIFGFIFNVVVEALIISFTISILRKSSGGAHASSPGKCAIIGTLTSISMALISKYYNFNINLDIILGCIIFIWSYYIIHKLAPIDSIAKPIKNNHKRARLKRNSMMILSVYLIIVITGILYFYIIKNYNILIYLRCIYIGMLWQALSLTKCGHWVIEKLDKLF